MKKQLWFVVALMFVFCSLDSYAQWRISTTQGHTYTGVITQKDQTLLRLRSFDDSVRVVMREEIQTMEKLGTRIETVDKAIFIGFVSFIDDEKIAVDSESHGEVEIMRSNIVKMEVVANIRELSNQGRKTVVRVVGNDSLNIPKAEDYTYPKRKSNSGSKSNYGMFGVTFLMPGGTNILFGGHSESAGFRMSGGFREKQVGVQMNIMMNLQNTALTEFNISLGGGFMKKEFKITYNPGYYERYEYIDEQIFYVGAFFDLNIAGFFGEIGLCATTGVYEFPQVFFQAGYVIRFNRE